MITDVKLIDPAIAKLSCENITKDLPEYFGIPEVNIKYAREILEKTSFAAFVDTEIVGLLTLEFPFQNNANIYWMAVKKAYHGKQIGTQLIEIAENYCYEHGFNTVTVETLSPKMNDENYLKTYQFYLHCGFKPMFELNTYGPELLMVYMYKLIRDGD